MTHGFADPQFQAVADEFSAFQDEGLDDGASLAIFQHGKPVLNLWAGADPDSGRGWEEHSVTTGFSITKGVTTVALLQLVDAGRVDLDAPVATYWPEFAAAGKESVSVRDIAQHRAALPYLDGPVDSFLTPGAAEKILAASAPQYPVGTIFNYHPVTFGTLVGHVVERVSGQGIGEYIQEHIASPLGLDLWVGLPASEDSRYLPNTYPALQLPPHVPEETLAQLPPEVVASVRSFEQLMDLFEADSRRAFVNTREFRAASLAGANGSTNAYSLAKMYAATLGKVDGVQLISDTTREMARSLGTADMVRPPLPDGTPQERPRWGVGFELDGVGTSTMMGEGSYGHYGMGGRAGFAHPESGIAFAYISQRMFLDPTGQQLDQRLVRLQSTLPQQI